MDMQQEREVPEDSSRASSLELDHLVGLLSDPPDELQQQRRISAALRRRQTQLSAYCVPAIQTVSLTTTEDNENQVKVSQA